MPRVVYVDDEVGLLEITKDFLEVDGEVQVDLVSCPTEALTKIDQGSYDVIISDYQMPSMNGIELLKALRIRGDRTPFILFTGRGREEVAMEALNNGANLYLQKGGDPKVQFGELRNAIIQLAQRKKAESLVAQGERKYRDLVEGANSIILKLEPSGNINFMNQFGMQFFGVGPDVIGKPVFGTLLTPQLYPEYDLESFTTGFFATGKFGDSYTFPARSGGKDAWVSWTFRAVRDGNDRVTEFLVIGNDVTALKQAEMKLQHSTAVLRATLDSSDEGILVVSNEGIISEYNRKFLDLWKIQASRMEGWTGEGLIDLTKGQLKDPDGFALYLEHCYAYPEQDSRLLLEFRDGRVMEVYSTPERIGDKITGRYWSFKDITLQKEFETGLLERHDNTRSLFVNNPAIMLLIEPDTGKVVHGNKAACSFYGYGMDAICGMRLSEITTLPLDEFNSRLQLAKSNRKNYFRAPHRMADGEVRDVEVFVAPINYKGRALLFSIVQDVSETKSTKRFLEESELRQNHVLNVISEGIVAIDGNNRVVYANARSSEVLRLPLGRIIGQDAHAFASFESSTDFSANLEKRRKGEKGHADYKLRRGDGSEFWAAVYANPIHTDGVFEGTIYAISDITERKEAELALHESEERFRNLIEMSPHAIVIVRDSRSIYANTRCVTMLGYESAGEIIGHPVTELFTSRRP